MFDIRKVFLAAQMNGSGYLYVTPVIYHNMFTQLEIAQLIKTIGLVKRSPAWVAKIEGNRYDVCITRHGGWDGVM